MQWWSRHPRFTDDHEQVFWLTEEGEPVAAVLRTDFAGFMQLDVVVMPGADELQAIVWQHALSQSAAAGLVPVRTDDATGMAALTAAGYLTTDGEPIVSCWLAAGHRPEIPALPPGYRLMSRSDVCASRWVGASVPE
ncbi:MAG: hypothetical protein J2P28_13435 [Actinobacteria bacterium]|nr:hypothetical protein [Actinomycetota bacterium]